ncbi:hypothetical protein MIR68_009613 [Amoeboaphelidium protococcarum]|nr:hypothetical protein MIR68_009613 [Amoeboaphelidium protococcarum]
MEVKAGDIAAKFRGEVKEYTQSVGQEDARPTLYAFLANEDEFAVKYARQTQKQCEEDGINFQLRQCDKNELEDAIVDANNDPRVHGIMVYYPVFGNDQDLYLQNIVNVQKDVEGLTHTFKFNMYYNIRQLPDGSKCIIPCTPLAVVKVLEHLNVYNSAIPYGNRLHGKTVCVINRSEVVGRPLAALLANDGAKVFSVDIKDIQVFTRGQGLKQHRHTVAECSLNLQQVLAQSDVVITGVPSKEYKVETDHLKDGVIAINFSSFKNFKDDITHRASIYVPSIGKLTVSMLERNLIRCHQNLSSK